MTNRIYTLSTRSTLTCIRAITTASDSRVLRIVQLYESAIHRAHKDRSGTTIVSPNPQTTLFVCTLINLQPTHIFELSTPSTCLSRIRLVYWENMRVSTGLWYQALFKLKMSQTKHLAFRFFGQLGLDHVWCTKRWQSNDFILWNHVFCYLIMHISS